MKDTEFSLASARAETHPPGYAIHKYWARKPHNVVRLVLETCEVGPGDIVIDPFCGSGVPLSEAANLGADCIGFDVNPIAIELTRTTVNPPDPELYRKAANVLLMDLEAEYSGLYKHNGEHVRYAVHSTVVVCPRCQKRISAHSARKRGRTYICPCCEQRLNFNLENLVATRTMRVVLDGGKQVETDTETTGPQVNGETATPFDFQFFHNARILAYRGMRTRNLFTARNFTVLASYAQRIDMCDEVVRAAIRLTLTGAVAQCSRLIAYRNDLSTGGPAWTVPGFWVPPIHLEMNPLVHLRSRIQRMYKGLKYLHSLEGRGSRHEIHLGDAGNHIRDTVQAEKRAKVIFLDPPYGDSVPYLEFSALWNSFLGKFPDPNLDIAVSNRTQGDSGWEKYRSDLARIISKFEGVLDYNGSIVVTFNNKDPLAWQALLAALQRAGYRCEGAFYQHPAVVSAKAQLALEGSYIGDFYCVFRPNVEKPTQNLDTIKNVLMSTLRAHQHQDVDADTLYRVAMLEWLRANIDVAMLDHLPLLIAEARTVRRPDCSEYGSAVSFSELAISTVEEMLKSPEPTTIAAVTAELHRRYSSIGVPSLRSLNELLGNHFLIEEGVVTQRDSTTTGVEVVLDQQHGQLPLI